MCYSSIKLWKIDKEYVMITSKYFHEKKLDEFGFKPILQFTGYLGSLKLFPPLDKHKILDPNVVFNPKSRLGKMHRIAIGIEQKYEQSNKERARAKYKQTKERKRTRIISTEVDSVSKDDISNLSCPICHFRLSFSNLEKVINPEKGHDKSIFHSGAYFLFDDVKKYIPYNYISECIEGEKDAAKKSLGESYVRAHSDIAAMWKFYKERRKNKEKVTLVAASKMSCYRCGINYHEKVQELKGGGISFLVRSDVKGRYNIKYYNEKWV